MKDFKKLLASCLVATLLVSGTSLSAFATSPEEGTFAEEDKAIGGYTTTVGNGPTQYYIDGILQRTRAVNSEYMGWNVSHDSGKTLSEEKFKGWSWTDMSAVSDPKTYPRHYTRVKIDSGSGAYADSGRKWTTSKRANASTAYIKYTAFATLDSFWGLEE